MEELSTHVRPYLGPRVSAFQSGGRGVHLGGGLDVDLQVLPQKTEVDIQKIK